MKYNQLATLQGENGWKYLKGCSSEMSNEDIVREANDYYRTVKMISVLDRKYVFPQTKTKEAEK